MIPLLAALAAGGSAALWAGPVGRALPFAAGAGPVRPGRARLPAGSRVGPLVAFVLVMPFVGVPAALLAGLAAVLVPRARRRRLAARTAERQRRAVPEVLRALAAELAAGSDAAAALAAVAAGLAPDDPLRADLDLAARPAGPHDALAASTVAALRDLASCWAVSRTAGAPLADVTARLATVADADAARHGELEAALAGPRASAQLLGALPVAGVGLAALLGGSPVHFLLHTVPGGACLVGGVVLDLLGLAWTGRRRSSRRAGS